jgi:hypothetical protein
MGFPTRPPVAKDTFQKNVTLIMEDSETNFYDIVECTTDTDWVVIYQKETPEGVRQVHKFNRDMVDEVILTTIKAPVH